MPTPLTYKRLITISRPRFWLYELGAFLVGCISAYSLTHSFDIPPSIPSIIVLIAFFIYFAFPANLLIYGINDIFDYETDIKNPKKTGYEDVLLPEQQSYVWKWILLTNIPFILGSIWYIFLYQSSQYAHVLISIFTSPILWSLGAFIGFATCYSAYPIRAKIRPGIDAFFSASHYIATALFGYYLFLGTQISDMGMSDISSVLVSSDSHLSTLLYGIAGICWAMAMHAYSAVPDIEADSTSGIQTIATSLGDKKTILVCTLLYIVSAGIVVFLDHSVRNILIALLVIPYMYMMKLTYDATRITDPAIKDRRIFELYKKFPTINASTGCIIFWIILLFTLSLHD